MLLHAGPRSGEVLNEASEKDFAKLALQTMRRIEALLGQDSSSATMTPHIWMQHEENFARALIAAGRAGEALDCMLAYALAGAG